MGDLNLNFTYYEVHSFNRLRGDVRLRKRCDRSHQELEEAKERAKELQDLYLVQFDINTKLRKELDEKNIKDDTIQYFLKIITLVHGILLLFNMVNAIGYFVNESRNAHLSEMKVKVDTLFVYDTIFVEKPVIKKVEIIDTLRLPVPITDTLMLHDTVFVHLPIEQRQYSNPRYTAWVSGYRPQLDSIHIYQRTEYITKEIKMVTKPKRWGLGLQAGYGVSLHNGQLCKR